MVVRKGMAAVVGMSVDGVDEDVVDGHMDRASAVAYDVAWLLVVAAGHRTLLDKSVVGVALEDMRKNRTSCYEYSHSDRGIADRAAFLNIPADQALAEKLPLNQYRLLLEEGLCDESGAPPSAAPLYENVRVELNCL